MCVLCVAKNYILIQQVVFFLYKEKRLVLYIIYAFFTIFATINILIMSDFNVYIKLKPFVQQFIQHDFGTPAVFPDKGPENSTIHHFVMRRPDDKAPDVEEDGLTAISIPDSCTKPARYYNYLTPRGKKAVAECCEYLFKRALWKELGDMSDIGCNMMTAIYAWCEQHGIAIDYADTIRQRWYRLRNAYIKNNIDLTEKNRHESSF